MKRTTTFTCRGVSVDIAAQVRAYATRRDLPIAEAVERLLSYGLKRAHGARALNASRSPEERAEAARHAVKARWKKHKRTAKATLHKHDHLI